MHRNSAGFSATPGGSTAKRFRLSLDAFRPDSVRRLRKARHKLRGLRRGPEVPGRAFRQPICYIRAGMTGPSSAQTLCLPNVRSGRHSRQQRSALTFSCGASRIYGADPLKIPVRERHPPDEIGEALRNQRATGQQTLCCPKGDVGFALFQTDPKLCRQAFEPDFWMQGTASRRTAASFGQGAQSTGEPFQRLLADGVTTCLISRTGKVWDQVKKTTPV